MQRIQAGRERKACHAFNKSQSCVNCAASLILVGLWVAEIGKNSITHVLRKKAIEPGDDAGADLLEGADNASILLRIQATGQFGRSDKITEQDRNLATFRIRLSG